ncbi:hypothetical protein [Brevibacillus sp. FSL L8-0710]|uniref:hypothetical protein n=1 Tax=Brevibacillus sp. FSL L8-0710 TaxID=2975313 RepID=UPI0030FBF06E
MKTHERDQMEAAMRDMAKLLSSYRKQLLKEGFSTLEAMMLVTAYQATLLTGGNKS